MTHTSGLAAGTSLAPDTATATVLASLVLDGQRWMITPGNQWDWSVVGRGNSGPSDFCVGYYPDAHLDLNHASVCFVWW